MGYVSLGKVFIQRALLGLVAAWAVVSLIFVLFTVTRDWMLELDIALARRSHAPDHEIEEIEAEYLASRDLDRPLTEQYVDWIVRVFTLDWGDSLETGEPALQLVANATIRTAMYVIPALVLAVVVGLLVGLYVALNPESRLANGGVIVTYALFAIPNFYVGAMLLSFASGGVIPNSWIVFEHALPIALTATSMLGGYVSFTRAHGLEHSRADFVRLVRAKGADRVRVGMHVVRNAAIPMVSMLFTEALALLVLAVFIVETLFGIEGLGLVLFEAIQTRDLPVILGGTMVLVAVGIVGNIFQDISYSVLDPRVDTGTR